MYLSGFGSHWLGKYAKQNRNKTQQQSSQTKIVKHRLYRFSLVYVSEAHLVLYYPLLCLMLATHSCPLYVGHVIELFSRAFPREHPVASVGILKSLQIINNNTASRGLPLSTWNCPGVRGLKSGARKVPPVALNTFRDFPRHGSPRRRSS